MLSETQFLTKLNERLSANALFEPGMAFVAMPVNKDGVYVTGFDWIDGKHHRTLFLEVAAEVNAAFTLNESLQDTDRSANTGLNGFVEGEHTRQRDHAHFQYSLRFDAGLDPKWAARFWRHGHASVVMSGNLKGNHHAGSALRAAFSAMVEALIDLNEDIVLDAAQPSKVVQFSPVREFGPVLPPVA